MKLHIVSVLVTLILGLQPLKAEEPRWSVSLSTDYMSQYVGFNNGGVFYDSPMFQTDLYVGHKSGFHADIWWATGLNPNLIDSGFDDEIDVNLGFGREISCFGQKIVFDLGVGYWDMFKVLGSTRNDIIHPYVEIGYPVAVSTNLVFTPYLKWDGYLLPFETDFEEGTFMTIGTKYRWDFMKKFSLTGLTAIGHDDGGFGFQSGFIWKLYGSLEYTVSKHLKIRPLQIQYYVPIDVSDRKPQWVIGTGVTFSL